MSPPKKPRFPDVGIKVELNGSSLHFNGQLELLNALVDQLYDVADDIDPMLDQVLGPDDGPEPSEEVSEYHKGTEPGSNEKGAQPT